MDICRPIKGRPTFSTYTVTQKGYIMIKKVTISMLVVILLAAGVGGMFKPVQGASPDCLNSAVKRDRDPLAAIHARGREAGPGCVRRAV